MEQDINEKRTGAAWVFPEINDPGDVRLIKVAPGNVLVLLSDGVYEFENDQGA